MTTIIYDVHNSKVYADRQMTAIDNQHNILETFDVSKILKNNNQVITGAGLSFLMNSMANRVTQFLIRYFGVGITVSLTSNLNLSVLKQITTTVVMFTRKEYAQYNVTVLGRIGPLFLFKADKTEDTANLKGVSYVLLGSGQDLAKDIILSLNKESSIPINMNKVFDHVSVNDPWTGNKYDEIDV